MSTNLKQDVNEAVGQIRRPAAPPQRGPEPEQHTGFSQTQRKKFYQHLSKDFLIGNRVVTAGDVIECTDIDKMPTRSTDQAGFFPWNQAEKLIAKNRGKLHPGPATVSIKRPSDDEVMESYGIQSGAANRMQAAAEKAVAPRQKAGGQF